MAQFSVAPPCGFVPPSRARLRAVVPLLRLRAAFGSLAMELGFYVVSLSYDSTEELDNGYLTVQAGDIVHVLAQDIDVGDPDGTYPEWRYCYAMLPPAHPPLAFLHGWVPVHVLGTRVTPVNNGLVPTYTGVVPDVHLWDTPFQDTENGLVPIAEEEPDGLDEWYAAAD